MRAMHEVIFYFLTPPKGRRTELPFSDGLYARLLKASHDRSADLFVAAVACVAVKLAANDPPKTAAVSLDAVKEQLDSLAFDVRTTKKRTLELLSQARSEVDARIAYVRDSRPKGFQFLTAPETYAKRPDKSETPDHFFRRVYGAEVRRGLTQADIRKADPAFYNVLHVWCTRHRRRLASLVPASRAASNVAGR
jgi:hypothetical protein